MSDKDGMGGFNMKQKIMAGGVVVILLIVIWQVMGLFGGGKNGEVTPATQAPPANKPPGQMTASAAPNAPNNMMPPGNAAPAPALIPQPAAAPRDQIAANAEIIKNQQEDQKKYLSSINQLQMLKLQRDIAETNQAIAAAKLATATAEQGINSLLTKPLPAPVPVGEYANKLVSPSSAGGPPGQPGQPMQDMSGVSYVVISVSMQMNRWAAVLGYQGKLYNVSVGDILPVDGWTVASISKEGVTLKKDNMRKKISLVPVI
jgi:type IV pilus biogenesis protein PilP